MVFIGSRKIHFTMKGEHLLYNSAVCVGLFFWISNFVWKMNRVYYLIVFLVSDNE